VETITAIFVMVHVRLYLCLILAMVMCC